MNRLMRGKMVPRTSFASLLLRLMAVAITLIVSCRNLTDRADAVAVPFDELKSLAPIEGGEFKFGFSDRIYVIEDQWEWGKTAKLLPELPKVNLDTDSLLVVTSWPSMPRAVKSVTADGETLIVDITQANPPEMQTADYQPPQYLIYKLPRWKGPIRFETNGEDQFAILRDKALEDFSYVTWEEFLRLHSGGMPSGKLLMRYWKLQQPDLSRDELVEKLKDYRQTYRQATPTPFYTLLMRDLVDAGSRDAVPRIFDLFRAMGEHDKAMEPATNAVIALAGPEIAEHCRRALDCDNRRSRNLGMGLLTRFEIGEARELAYPRLADADLAMCQSSLKYLITLGLCQEDGPHLVKALSDLEKRAHAPPTPNPRTIYWSWKVVDDLVDAIVSLDELPAGGEESLKRIAAEFPVPAMRSHAEKALQQISPNQTDHK